ncbi:hypothetical protein [Staphylococcus epidermidis]|nr:hypothetical protein HMPREF0789_0953 [Staphylococcus epidermidis BCM-HMP0060]MCG1200348.1 hypothetical protein [Staphylococcus epidermidis]MCG1352935.1 hypothetical protein [Staphylococcus epidermidis]MCG1634453.1 hypothetical protein [Staphylococcus epidermidis]MCG1686684.1 hypothetical protein [Staphylococcus epidermidis]
MNIGLSSTPTIDVKNKALKCLGLCFNFVNKIEKIDSFLSIKNHHNEL